MFLRDFIFKFATFYLSIFLVFALILSDAVAEQATKIGFVDVQRVIVSSSAGREAKDRLEKEKNTMQKEIDTKKTEIDKIKEELEKKAMVLSPEVKKEKEELMQRKIREVRRLLDDYQKELDLRDQELTQKILQDLGGVIDKLGKEKNYIIIFEKRGAGIIYGSKEIDLTDEIMKMFDEEKTKKTK